MVNRTETGGITNKQKRSQVYGQIKTEKKKLKKEGQEKRKKLAEQLGEAAPPKQVPKTLDNQREADETVVQPDDEEVVGEDVADEFSAHFAGRPPRVMITTSAYPTPHLCKLVSDMLGVIPNSSYRKRMAHEIKDIVNYCKNKEFTVLLVFCENKKQGKFCKNEMWMVHLPDGPTAHFKLTNLKLVEEIRGHGNPSEHKPEIILNNFSTRLGHRMGRLLATLFPHDPQLRGRRVVTLHNQRDFIFFRHHRYIFEESDKAETGVKTRLQECGPRFTLKLKSLQAGTFNTTTGEYEWVYKSDMDRKNRRRFHM